MNARPIAPHAPLEDDGRPGAVERSPTLLDFWRDFTKREPEYPPLRTVRLRICQACLDGEPSECHTPGCALWLHRIDLPIHRELYEIVPDDAGSSSVAIAAEVGS